VPLTMTSLIDLNQTLNRGTKVLLVMDVVESVRLMEADEDGFVQRWQQLVQQSEQQILPLHGGRIVKSLGDGLMLEFLDAAGCVKAAFALQTFSRQANQGFAADRQIHLRMGGHVAAFVTDKHDIYGTDVNLTARFATLAEPGDVLISAELRDCLPAGLDAGLDAEIEDLGKCYLKHLSEPIQVYRAWPVSDLKRVPAEPATAPDFRPTVAVVPFEARSNYPEDFVIGELLADGIIAQLSRSADLRVISRTALRGPGAVSEAESRLAASFVLSGSYIASGSKILIMAELAEAHSSQVIWADRLSGDTMDLLQAQSELVNRIAAAASRALIDSEVQQSLVQPLPRLDSGALLLGGIALMHRSSLRDFERSRAVLEALMERHNRAATPRAWLAKWYTMRVIRGTSTEPAKDTRLALEQTRTALNLSPDDALSVAIEGYARCQLPGEADAADHSIEHAIELNPNEPLDWLYKSVWSAIWGLTASAVTEAEHAAQLSPINPLKYFFDVILASAQITNGDCEKPAEPAKRSLRENWHHQPALRVSLQAQTESGKLLDAHDTLKLLLVEIPNLTVANYLSLGSPASTTRQRFAEVFRKMGIPES
jgi:adenylate cyclase